jgi:trehalose-6-phosphatase
MTRYVFDDMGYLREKVRQASHIMLCMEFEGVLIPHEEEEWLPSLSPQLHRALWSLAEHDRVTMAIVSQRRRTDLQLCIGLPDVYYLGCETSSKTSSIKWLARHFQDSHPLMIYLGDESAEQDLFQAFRSGLTLCVEEAQESSAEYHLEGLADVRRFLEWIVCLLDEPEESGVAALQFAGTTRADTQLSHLSRASWDSYAERTKPQGGFCRPSWNIDWPEHHE